MKRLTDHQHQNLRLLRLCAIATWKSEIEWYSENKHFKDMIGIDGMPTVFKWKIFPGITTLGLLEKIQSLIERPTV